MQAWMLDVAATREAIADVGEIAVTGFCLGEHGTHVQRRTRMVWRDRCGSRENLVAPLYQIRAS
jgi:hypothetical protein